MSSDKGNHLLLSDFRLGHAHFELRTAPKFLHWDRAGAIWTEMIEKEPRLTFAQGEPNKTAFSLDNKYILSIILDSSGSPPHPHTSIRGTAHSPHQSLKDFTELLETFTGIVQAQLGIEDYLRIGLRLIFYKEYKDRETASQAMLSTNLMRIPEGHHFGIKGLPTLPECVVRLEDGKNGVAIRLKVDSFKYEFTPPPDWQGVEPISKKSDRVTYEVDSYTEGIVAIGQFNVAEWINQRLHSISRDSDKFLRGA